MVNQPNDNRLQAIYQNFGNQLGTRIHERDWSIITDCFRAINLRDQCDEGCVNTFKTGRPQIEIITKAIEITPYDVPALLHK